METETTTEEPTVTENTDTNEPDVSGLTEAQLKEELARVRRESAGRRIELRDLKSKAEEWDKYQESLKTEQQKLQERAEAAEKEIQNLRITSKRESALKDAGLDADLIEFVTGSDDDTIKSQVEKLKTKFGSSAAHPATQIPDLLAGTRGKPVGSSGPSFDDLIRQAARRD